MSRKPGKTKLKKISRKAFIESQGATCNNWQWSWSFVNDKEKFVIFGAWDINKTEDGTVVLAESWERDERGYRKPGYSQAVEHIRLVESGGYALKTFRMFYSTERQNEQGQGPATIKDFTPKLESKTLKKDGDRWIAVG